MILPPYYRQFEIPAPSFSVKGDHPACGYSISLSGCWDHFPSLRTFWPVRGPEKSLLYKHGAIGALGFSQRSVNVACRQICFCISDTFLNNAVKPSWRFDCGTSSPFACDNKSALSSSRTCICQVEVENETFNGNTCYWAFGNAEISESGAKASSSLLLYSAITHTHIRDRFCVRVWIADLTDVGDSTSHIVVFLSFSNPPMRPWTTCNAPTFNNLACFCTPFPANCACNLPKKTIGLPMGTDPPAT